MLNIGKLVAGVLGKSAGVGVGDVQVAASQAYNALDSVPLPSKMSRIMPNTDRLISTELGRKSAENRKINAQTIRQ